MNLRNEIIMEIQNADKAFRAHFPQNSSYQECYDFLVKCVEKIIEMSKQQAEQAAAQQPQDAPTQQPDAAQEPLVGAQG